MSTRAKPERASPSGSGRRKAPQMSPGRLQFEDFHASSSSGRLTSRCALSCADHPKAKLTRYNYSFTVFSRRWPHRPRTAFFVVLSLLFSQLAMAGYLCPVQANVRTMAAMMAAGQPCEGMDKTQPALCHEHAWNAAQSFENIKLPAVSQPVIVQVLELPLVRDADQAVAPPMTATAEARPPPDPLFLSTLRLRV